MTVPAGVGALFRVWGTGARDVLAVGEGGVVIHYDGRSWQKMTSPVSSALRGIWGSGPGDVFAVGDGCVIIHYDGETWRKMSTPTCYALKSVWGSGPTDVFAVRPCLHYDGKSWMPLPECDDWGRAANDIWGSGAGDVYVVGGAKGEGGYSFATHFDGKTWNSAGAFWETTAGMWVREVRGVWGTGPADVYAVGSRVVHFDGQTWRIMPVPWLSDGGGDSPFPHFPGNGGWSSGPADVFVVDGGGKVTHFDGHDGAEMVTGTTEDLFGIWGSGPDDVFAVGSNATILHFSCFDEPSAQ